MVRATTGVGSWTAMTGRFATLATGSVAGGQVEDMGAMRDRAMPPPCGWDRLWLITPATAIDQVLVDDAADRSRRASRLSISLRISSPYERRRRTASPEGGPEKEPSSCSRRPRPGVPPLAQAQPLVREGDAVVDHPDEHRARRPAVHGGLGYSSGSRETAPEAPPAAPPGSTGRSACWRSRSASDARCRRAAAGTIPARQSRHDRALLHEIALVESHAPGAVARVALPHRRFSVLNSRQRPRRRTRSGTGSASSSGPAR